MLKKILFVSILLLIVSFASSQTIPSSRTVDWSLAGLQDTVPAYSNILNIIDFGAVGDGVTINDNAINSAIASLSGTAGVIYFPEGVFLFNSQINIPDSIIIKGASSSLTTLKFNLGGHGNSFMIEGSYGVKSANLTQSAPKFQKYIITDNSALFTINDLIKITINDSTIMYSNWAYGNLGQIVKISNINHDTLFLQSPLRMDYTLTYKPKIRQITPTHDVGFECFKIERLDACDSTEKTTNIYFELADKCWVVGVESHNTNFAHITLSNSTNCLVRGCYIHHSFDYGEGGRGYGTMVQYTSGENLIENNIFYHLRHSMILQVGANGNVFGYNYSLDPYWTQPPLPSNSSGDMVCHGNYPYANLFEGNIGQNIIIDNSHGKNGPYNTFFRNRAELYGIFMDASSNSDYQNFVGNEITNTGFFMGLYTLNGVDYFEYGNNVKSTIKPTGTSYLPDSTYYLKHNQPCYWTTAYNWPDIGTPYPYSQGSIPANNRYILGCFTDCINNPITNITNVSNKNITVFPNPTRGIINVNVDFSIKIIKFYNLSNKLIFQSVNNKFINLHVNSPGIYLMKVEGENGEIIYSKIVLIKD